MKPVICKEPWPALPIEAYSSPESGAWGYLVIYEDLTFQFDTSRIPSREEILDKWPGLSGDVGSFIYPNNS